MHSIFVTGALAVSVVLSAQTGHAAPSDVDASSSTDSSEIGIAYDRVDDRGVVGQCAGKEAGIHFFAIPANDSSGPLTVQSGRWCFAVDDTKGLLIAAAGNCWQEHSGIVDSSGLKKDADVSDLIAVNLSSHAPLPGHPDVVACLKQVGEELSASKVQPAAYLGDLLAEVGSYWHMTPEELDASGIKRR